jgi:hypothetical protein
MFQTSKCGAKARHAGPGAGLSTSSVHGNEKKARATNGQRVMQQQPMMPFMLIPHRYNQSRGLPSATFVATSPDSRRMVNLKNRREARALRAYARLHRPSAPAAASPFPHNPLN